VQLLVGLALYLFISPNTTAAMHDFGGAMHMATTRFFLVEHPFGMIIAIALAHLGKIRAARGARNARTFYAVSLIVLLASQPWPGLPYGRPLFRFSLQRVLGWSGTSRNCGFPLRRSIRRLRLGNYGLEWAPRAFWCTS
jgi:hypothetical protein